MRLPRLGAFADNQENTPVDFGEIIAAAAPKDILIIVTELNRYTDIPALKEMMKPVQQVYDLYGKKGQLTVKYAVGEINRMTEEMYAEIGEFFNTLYERELNNK